MQPAWYYFNDRHVLWHLAFNFLNSWVDERLVWPEDKELNESRRILFYFLGWFHSFFFLFYERIVEMIDWVLTRKSQLSFYYVLLSFFTSFVTLAHGRKSDWNGSSFRICYRTVLVASEKKSVCKAFFKQTFVTLRWKWKDTPRKHAVTRNSRGDQN